MTYSIVLLFMVIGTITAFLPYSFLIYNTPPPSLGQYVFAQGDSALGESSDTSESGDGAKPTGGGEGGTEGPVDESLSGENGDIGTDDDTEPTGDDSEQPSALSGDQLNGDPPSTEAYVCNGDTGICSCDSWSDCQTMQKDGVCESGGNPLWGLNIPEDKVPDDAKSGSCKWGK
jgi:hypothetical protein